MTSRYFSGYFVFVDDPSRVSRYIFEKSGNEPPFLRVEDGKNWGKSREKCVNRGAATRSIVTRREKKGKRGGEGERDRTLSHVDVDAVYLDTDGSLNQPTASNKHHLAITHAYRRVCAC